MKNLAVYLAVLNQGGSADGWSHEDQVSNERSEDYYNLYYYELYDENTGQTVTRNATKKEICVFQKENDQWCRFGSCLTDGSCQCPEGKFGDNCNETTNRSALGWGDWLNQKLNSESESEPFDASARSSSDFDATTRDSFFDDSSNYEIPPTLRTSTYSWPSNSVHTTNTMTTTTYKYTTTSSTTTTSTTIRTTTHKYTTTSSTTSTTMPTTTYTYTTTSSTTTKPTTHYIYTTTQTTTSKTTSTTTTMATTTMTTTDYPTTTSTTTTSTATTTEWKINTIMTSTLAPCLPIKYDEKSVTGYDLQENKVIWSSRLFFIKVNSPKECGIKCDIFSNTNPENWYEAPEQGPSFAIDPTKCVSFRYHKENNWCFGLSRNPSTAGFSYVDDDEYNLYVRRAPHCPNENEIVVPSVIPPQTYSTYPVMCPFGQTRGPRGCIPDQSDRLVIATEPEIMPTLPVYESINCNREMNRLENVGKVILEKECGVVAWNYERKVWHWEEDVRVMNCLSPKVEIDFGSIREIGGVISMGTDDGWVSEFEVYTKDNAGEWHLHQTLNGNDGINLKSLGCLHKPLKTRFIRLNPIDGYGKFIFDFVFVTPN